MSDPTWICTNNPWHDWDGLTCRWCDATRTPAEAIVSGLASRRGGTEDAAKALLDAHHAEQRREGARLLEDAACDADWTRTPDFCAGLRAGAELLLAAGEKATAEAATATPALTVYRASHDSIVMGLYTTAAEARKHCEAEERRAWAKSETPTFDWIEDDEDGVAEMTAFVGGEECETGYVVTALEIASKYDPEADE
jgi:hypothetical protein